MIAGRPRLQGWRASGWACSAAPSTRPTSGTWYRPSTSATSCSSTGSCSWSTTSPGRRWAAGPSATPRPASPWCAAAVADVPGLEPSRIEIDAGGPSYTADTLAALLREAPDRELFVILGDDAAAGLERGSATTRCGTSPPSSSSSGPVRSRPAAPGLALGRGRGPAARGVEHRPPGPGGGRATARLPRDPRGRGLHRVARALPGRSMTDQRRHADEPLAAPPPGRRARPTLRPAWAGPASAPPVDWRGMFSAARWLAPCVAGWRRPALRRASAPCGRAGPGRTVVRRPAPTSPASRASWSRPPPWPSGTSTTGCSRRSTSCRSAPATRAAACCSSRRPPGWGTTWPRWTSCTPTGRRTTTCAAPSRSSPAWGSTTW